ncbi:MAG: tetratricopeptide repeat protein [Mariprofundales bacterium]
MTRLMLALAAGLLLTNCGGSSNHNSDATKLKQGHIHYEMGVDALRKGNIPIAFRELLKAQSFQPDDAQTSAALALAWRYRGDLDQSKKLYQQALARQATPAMHNNYGSLLMQMGAQKEAEKQFRLALDDPRYSHQDLAFINLGDLLVSQGKYDQAISTYRQASLLNPRQSASRLREAKAFADSGRAPYAEALLLTLLRQQPDNRTAIKAVLPLLKQRHARQKAQSLLQLYLQPLSDNSEAQQWVSNIRKQIEAWQ